MLCPICKLGNSKELVNYSEFLKSETNEKIKLKIYYYLCDTNGCKFFDKDLEIKNKIEKNKVLGYDK